MAAGIALFLLVMLVLALVDIALVRAAWLHWHQPHRAPRMMLRPTRP